MSIFRKISRIISSTLAVVIWIGCNLGTSSAVAAGCSPGPQANLVQCNFVAYNFGSADLTGADLRFADLRGADLSKASLSGIMAGHLVNGSCGFLPSGWACVNGWITGPTARLIGADFYDIPTGLPADLSGSNFSYSHLGPFAQIQGTKFSNVDFTGAHLRADFARCDLTGSKFNQTDITDADFTSSNFAGVTSSGVTGTPKGLPLGVNLLGGYLIGPNISLAGADLSGLDLSSFVLTGIIGGPLLGDPERLPAGWAVINHYLVGPGANLSGVDFSGADLSNVNLTGANLEGSNLSNVIMPTTPIQGVIGAPMHLPAGWTLQNGEILRLLSGAPSVQISGKPVFGEKLTAITPRLTEETSITITWLRDGVSIISASGNMYVAGKGDIGHQISFRATYAKAGYLDVQANSAAVYVSAATLPRGKAPTIKGTAKVGFTLTLVSTKLVPTATFSYQWLLDGKPIKGAAKSTYKLIATQKGHKISVKVTQNAPGYASASATSTAIKVG